MISLVSLIPWSHPREGLTNDLKNVNTSKACIDHFNTCVYAVFRCLVCALAHGFEMGSVASVVSTSGFSVVVLAGGYVTAGAFEGLLPWELLVGGVDD